MDEFAGTGGLRSLSPAETIPIDTERGLPEPGIALCLSGGGYRAMLFHVGAILRLNELAYLPKLSRISSVSGGSISAAFLGLKWGSLGFNAEGVAIRLEEEFVRGIRRFASTTIDVGAVIKGLVLPGSVSDRVANAYRRHLYGTATLQHLPDNPRFVINATNVQSGALWRFMKPYMRDWRVGEVRTPQVSLARAVAASSAFPPFLSPMTLRLRPGDFTSDSGADLQKEPYTSRIVLTDGGAYDNLGLETAWKRYSTVLVSDGGGAMQPQGKPKRDWAFHAYRVFNVVDNQVRSLRKRQVIESFKLRDRLVNGGEAPDSPTVQLVSRQGTYWGIRTNIRDYGLDSALDCPYDKTLALANVGTRLAKLPESTQDRLINWGYAVCDAALRRHVAPELPLPGGFPYPGGVG